MVQGGDGTKRVVWVIAILGLCALLGVCGIVGVGSYFFHRASEDSAAAQASTVRIEAEREAQKRSWLDSLPADQRVVFAAFDGAERAATGLVQSILDGTGDGPDVAVAREIRALAGSRGGVPALSSPRSHSSETAGRMTSLTADVAIEWSYGDVTTVRVSLERAEDGTLTASAIEIVDAASSE